MQGIDEGGLRKLSDFRELSLYGHCGPYFSLLCIFANIIIICKCDNTRQRRHNLKLFGNMKYYF